MKTASSVFLTIALSTIAALAADPQPSSSDELVKNSMRIPFIAVPMGGGIHVDGQVRKGEWVHFAKLSDMIASVDRTDDNGVAAPEQTEVWITYDETALCVGFKMHMREGVAPLVTVTEGRDTGHSDDAFEIFLVPEGSEKIYHFGGNAAGIVWDRVIEKGAFDWSWNRDVAYKAVVDRGNNWWTGEWRIPWKMLDQPGKPKNGEIWRANFAANRRAPEQRVDTWSYWSKWGDQPNNGRLIFGGPEAATMVMMGLTRDTWDGSGMRPAVAPPPSRKPESPMQFDYKYELWRKEKPGGTSFLKDLQTRRAAATGEAATWASFEKDVGDALKDYKVVRQLHKQQPHPARGWTGPWGDTIKVNEAGDYLLSWIFREVTDPAQPRLVAGGAVPFRIRTGLQMEVWPYLLTRQSVVLQADLRAVPGLKEVKTLRGQITPKGGGKALVEKTVDWNGEKRQEMEVENAASVKPGNLYEARLQALDESGKVVSEAVAPFRRPPEPDWWVNRAKYGSEPEVPKPWTPIQWNQDRKLAKVWGREITFGASALPVKVITQGQNLLATPIELELTAAGKVQRWKDVSFKVVETRPGHVLVESVRQAAGVRVKTTTRFEFDGCSIVDLSIEPVEASPSIDRLDLVMAVKPEHGYFLTNYRHAPGPGKAISRFSGTTPDHYESPPMLTTWLGTDTYGLEWSCESSRGWYLTEPNKAIEVDKKADRVEARFHLIDGTMQLKAPRQIRFALIATPTKPVPPEWRRLRIDSLAGWPFEPGVDTVKGGAVATEKDFEEWERQYKGADVSAMLLPLAWSGYDCWHPHVTDPKTVEKMKHAVARLKKYNMKGLWNGGWGIAPYAPQWDPWGKEMVAHPLQPTFANQYIGSYGSPFVEFMVGSFALNVRDLGIEGIRFDTVVPWYTSQNPYLGEAWTSDVPLPDGKPDPTVYPTQNLFRQREMLKRLWRVFNGQYTEGGMFWMGIAGPPIMTVESFIHLRDIGEGFYMNATSIKEAYPQDMMRPWMTHRAYGFLEVNHLKGKPLPSISRLGPLLVLDASMRITGRDYFNEPTYAPSHPEKLPARQIWDAWSWIDRGTSTFHPYWENKKVLKTTGSGEHYASFHLQKGKRILLVIANYEKQPQTVSFEFDLKALGFASATLEGLDAVDRRPVAIENGTLSLEVLPECFRLVKIGLPGEPTGNNLDPKHPDPLP